MTFLRHLRRWPNIETASGECPLFAGNAPFHITTVKPFHR